MKHALITLTSSGTITEMPSHALLEMEEGEIEKMELMASELDLVRSKFPDRIVSSRLVNPFKVTLLFGDDDSGYVVKEKSDFGHTFTHSYLTLTPSSLQVVIENDSLPDDLMIGTFPNKSEFFTLSETNSLILKAFSGSIPMRLAAQES